MQGDNNNNNNNSDVSFKTDAQVQTKFRPRVQKQGSANWLWAAADAEKLSNELAIEWLIVFLLNPIATFLLQCIRTGDDSQVWFKALISSLIGAPVNSFLSIIQNH